MSKDLPVIALCILGGILLWMLVSSDRFLSDVIGPFVSWFGVGDA